MANNYCESSSWLDIPRNKAAEARKIIDRIEEELENDDGYVGCNSTLQVTEERCGVWFSGDESCNADHVERIARALIEELDIREDFVCSWAYNCDKPRIDEFGGGAFLIRKGEDTVWCDAASRVREMISEIEQGRS